MNQTWMGSKTRGFTLVELLIVIVIIAILAGITLVTYNGIQNRATDSANLANANVIAKAITAYQIENGNYPICPGGDGTSCPVTSIASMLSPVYISSIPNDTKYAYQYVGTTSNSGMWSIRMYKRQISNYCKVGSSNMLVSWWTSAPAC